MIPEIYKGKDVKWFCGEPDIKPSKRLEVTAYNLRAERKPFMGSYEVQVERGIAIVWQGKTVVANHRWGSSYTLIVCAPDAPPTMGPALIALCALAYPGQRLTSERSPEGQKAYEDAWALIQKG